MAVIEGQRTTGNVASGQRKIDMAKTIALLDPNATPFTSILNQTAKGGNRQKLTDPEFRWVEDEREARWDLADGSHNSSVTTVNVDNGERFFPGAIVKVPGTGETFRVTTVSSNALTVVRGFGGTTAATIADDAPLLITTGSNDEGSRSREIRTFNPDFMKNYAQIFKTSVGESETWRASENETSPADPAHQRNKKGIEHQLDKEYAALFGVPSETAGSDGPLRTTGGLDHFCTENRQGVGGTLTEAVWEQFVAEKAFKHGGTEKTMFCAPFLVSVLNSFARSKLNTTVGQNKYGVNYATYVSPHGRLALISHKLLEGAVYGRMGFVLDLKADVKYRYLRDTKLLTNRQESDRDGRKDEYLTEAGFQVGQVKKHAVISGVTG